MALSKQEQRALARIEFNLAFDDGQRVSEGFMRIIRDNPEVFGWEEPEVPALPSSCHADQSSWLYWLMLVGIAMMVVMVSFQGSIILGLHHETGLWP
jgi:hypothetical protein